MQEIYQKLYPDGLTEKDIVMIERKVDKLPKRVRKIIRLEAMIGRKLQ